MQPSEIQNYKTELISWINKLEDITILEELKMLMQAEQSGDDFSLMEEQIFILEEGAAKYESSEEPGYTWIEISNEANNVFELSEEQKAEVREAVSGYLSGEDKGYTWEEVKERAIKKCNEKKA